MEKCEALLAWTLVPSVFALALSLMGTFLARSGIFSSVRSFANDPERGLLLNNIILSACCLTVLIGTLHPLGLELATGTKATVGPPYFNTTFLPLFGLAVLVAAVGPFLPGSAPASHRWRVCWAPSSSLWCSSRR